MINDFARGSGKSQAHGPIKEPQLGVVLRFSTASDALHVPSHRQSNRTGCTHVRHAPVLSQPFLEYTRSSARLRQARTSSSTTSVARVIKSGRLKIGRLCSVDTTPPADLSSPVGQSWLLVGCVPIAGTSTVQNWRRFRQKAGLRCAWLVRDCLGNLNWHRFWHSSSAHAGEGTHSSFRWQCLPGSHIGYHHQSQATVWFL